MPADDAKIRELTAEIARLEELLTLKDRMLAEYEEARQRSVRMFGGAVDPRHL